MRRAAAVCLLLVLTVGAAAAAPAENNDSAARPPAVYCRPVEFLITDRAGRPLPGARLDLAVHWGRVLTWGPYASGPAGRIDLTVQPVADYLHTGLQSGDTLIAYRFILDYRVEKAGYLPETGRIEDEQEFAAYSDPMYQALDKRPSDRPYEITIPLTAYTDYLAAPRALDPVRLKPLVDALIQVPALDPTPGSMSLDNDRLQIGVTFLPLFDPAETAAETVGAILLRDVLPVTAGVLEKVFGGELQGASHRVEITTSFRPRSAPFALSEGRTFVYDYGPEAAAKLVAGRPEEIESGQIEARLGRHTLNLFEEE